MGRNMRNITVAIFGKFSLPLSQYKVRIVAVDTLVLLV